MKGIEPSSQPWEGHILPLNHTRVRTWTLHTSAPAATASSILRLSFVGAHISFETGRLSGREGTDDALGHAAEKIPDSSRPRRHFNSRTGPSVSSALVLAACRFHRPAVGTFAFLTGRALVRPFTVGLQVLLLADDGFSNRAFPACPALLQSSHDFATDLGREFVRQRLEAGFRHAAACHGPPDPGRMASIQSGVCSGSTQPRVWRSRDLPSPAGQTFVTGIAQGDAQQRAFATRRVIAPFEPCLTGMIIGVAFFPDGSHSALSCRRSEPVSQIDLSSPRPLFPSRREVEIKLRGEFLRQLLHHLDASNARAPENDQDRS